MLALCIDPSLLECEGLPYPNDVKERARHILHCLKGHGVGMFNLLCNVVITFKVLFLCYFSCYAIMLL